MIRYIRFIFSLVCIISSFQPPYYGNEVQKSAENDINFIEQPVVPPQPAEPTNEVPQQPNNNNNNYNDPSIISRPKNSNRSTSFFAQPGTLAGKSHKYVVHIIRNHHLVLLKWQISKS